MKFLKKLKRVFEEEMYRNVLKTSKIPEKNKYTYGAKYRDMYICSEEGIRI